MHGEAAHLTEHVAFAKARGVKEVVRAFNGDLVKLAEGDARVIGQLPFGRRYKDGEILLAANQTCVAERRRLGFAGVVSIALALTAKGEMSGDPDVLFSGLPLSTREGAGVDALIDAAIFETFEGLPRGKRRDPDFVSGAVERATAQREATARGPARYARRHR